MIRFLYYLDYSKVPRIMTRDMLVVARKRDAEDNSQ